MSEPLISDEMVEEAMRRRYNRLLLENAGEVVLAVARRGMRGTLEALAPLIVERCAEVAEPFCPDGPDIAAEIRALLETPDLITGESD